MRTRRRALVALAVALAIHVATVGVVTRVSVHAVADRPSTRVEVALVAPHALRPTPPTPTPVPTKPIAVPDRTTPPPPSTTPPEVASAPPPPTTSPAPTTSAPTPDWAPAPTEPPVVAEPAPKSLLERVLAGSSVGPRPSLDTLDPSRRTPDDDAARAKHFIDRIARVDRLSVDAGPTSILSELVPLDGGGYTYATGGFVAEIHVDGSVVFKDDGGKTGLSSGTRGPHNEMVTERDPAIDGAPFAHSGGVHGSQAGGSFDPTAAALRAQGQDPYFSEKSCFLDDTADLRADLREKHELVQMATLRRDLERAWFDETHTLAERHARIFSIWDECREDGVGRKARELVESFVRQHMPKKSHDAFTDEELVAFNGRRTSTEEFWPYG